MKVLLVPGLTQKSPAARKNVTTAKGPDTTPENAAPGAGLHGRDPPVAITETDQIRETEDVATTVVGHPPQGIAGEAPTETIEEEMNLLDVTMIVITVHPSADDLLKGILDVSST
jgi:hypothetical protein